MTTPGTPCRSPPGTGSPARSCWPPSAPPPTATGPPAATLTDNGMVFTTRLSGGKGGRNSFEHELRHRGITQKNGRPNHPPLTGQSLDRLPVLLRHVNRELNRRCASCRRRVTLTGPGQIPLLVSHA